MALKTTFNNVVLVSPWGTEGGIKIDRILNVTGLLCPQPHLIATKALAEMKRGETLEMISTDKSTKNTIPFLCQKGRYKLLQTREEDGHIHFVIEK